MQNTWKPPDQSSLHDFCRTGTTQMRCANLFFLQKTILALRRPEVVADRSARSPQGRTEGPNSPRGLNKISAMNEVNGGAERDRTADPLLAKQVLSQLSYSPNSLGTALADSDQPKPVHQHHCRTILSTVFSYQHRIHQSKWWARVDSNYRPHAYQACALTN